jgi:V8-like Glu-specific endopeptidase
MTNAEKKLIAISSVALITLMALSGTAYAIKNGQPDDENKWSYVCWIVTYPGTGDYVYLSTGSLIAPTVVLTAGHVADVGSSEDAWAYVSFAPTASWPDSWPPGAGSDWIEVDSWYTHPSYRLGGGSKGLTDWITHDVGVLILDEEVTGVGLAELPVVGLVDTLPMRQDVDLVGYGVQYQVRGAGIPPPDNWDWIDFGYRYYAHAQLIAGDFEWNNEFVMLTTNPGQGKGGTCYGDSGSPILLAGTNIVLAVCSWGTNGNCAGVSYEYRIDQPDILGWINSFPLSP